MAQVWFYVEGEETDMDCTETDVIPRVGEYVEYEFKPSYPDRFNADALTRGTANEGDYLVTSVAHRFRRTDMLVTKHYVDVKLRRQ